MVESSTKTPTKEELEVAILSSPITLPCGIKLPNRLVKAAMEEMLGPLGGGDPTEALFILYQEWAKGNYGLILTGNVMISSNHLGTPADIIIPFPSIPSTSSTNSTTNPNSNSTNSTNSTKYQTSLSAFKSWSTASKSHNSKAALILQLNHTGRQSLRFSKSLTSILKLTPNLSCSNVPLNAGTGVLAKVFSRIMWGTPREMTIEEIDQVVDGFVQGAKVAKETGFDGVQLHNSHGYLLAQFLSPNVNLRTDSYGGSPFARTKLLFRIIDAIRNEFPMESGFCLGIKLNCSDYVKGGLTESDALDNVRWIAEHGGIDFIEISGGTYEAAVMLEDEAPPSPPFTSSHSTPLKSNSIEPSSSPPSKREAFFLHFSTSAQLLLNSLPPSSLPTPVPLILLTGGFRTRTVMASAISSGSTSLIGLGRPTCVDPLLPLTLLNPGIKDAQAIRYEIKGIKTLKLLPIGIIGPGLSTLFHTLLLGLISKGLKGRELEKEAGRGVLELVWKVWGRGVWERYWTVLTLGVLLCYAIFVKFVI